MRGGTRPVRPAAPFPRRRLRAANDNQAPPRRVLARWLITGLYCGLAGAIAWWAVA